jgi:hypothetical protein
VIGRPLWHGVHLPMCGWHLAVSRRTCCAVVPGGGRRVYRIGVIHECEACNYRQACLRVRCDVIDWQHIPVCAAMHDSEESSSETSTYTARSERHCLCQLTREWDLHSAVGSPHASRRCIATQRAKLLARY